MDMGAEGKALRFDEKPGRYVDFSRKKSTDLRVLITPVLLPAYARVEAAITEARARRIVFAMAKLIPLLTKKCQFSNLIVGEPGGQSALGSVVRYRLENLERSLATAIAAVDP